MAAVATTSNGSPLPARSYEPRQKHQNDTVRDWNARIDIADLTANNIGQLRKLNSALFPVRFGEKWYKDVLDEDVSKICKFALFNDIPVGTICCRIESAKEGSAKIYIMTLGCLAPYRRLGIATKLLGQVLSVAGPGKQIAVRDREGSKVSKKTSKEGKGAQEEPIHRETLIESVYLHVQTSNQEARLFYEKHGFLVKSQIDDYYKIGIVPRSAWLLEKTTGA